MNSAISFNVGPVWRVLPSFSGCSRLVRGTATALLMASLAGCGILSGAGPYQSSISMGAETTDPRYDVVDLTAETVGAYVRSPIATLTSDVSQLKISDVYLTPGDVIAVMISDSAQEGALFAPLSAGGTGFPRVRVDASGKISLPYVGSLKVSGMTLDQVQVAVRDRLKGKAIDPQVHTEVVGDMSGSVLVAGAVNAPGRFSALTGPLTLLDAINQAGGTVLEPHLATVIVRTGSKVYTYSYQDLLQGKNQPVPPHSEIVVERARQRFVAMGSVNKPGLHDLPSSNPSLLETLGAVGGLDDAKADPTGVFVFRRTEDGTQEPRAQVFRLNMRNPESIFLAKEFLVRPEDAIYVTNAAVYEWQKIITPIVQTILLGQRF